MMMVMMMMLLLLQVCRVHEVDKDLREGMSVTRRDSSVLLWRDKWRKAKADIIYLFASLDVLVYPVPIIRS